MKAITAIMVLALVGMVSAGPIGVAQDYMEDGVVYAPLGQTVCHKIRLKTNSLEDQSQIQMIVIKIPDFVDVNLSENGIYTTTRGSTDSIIFHISPTDQEINSTYSVPFRVKGVEEPASGMVPLEGSIASKFKIKVVPSDTIVENNCNELESASIRPNKEKDNTEVMENKEDPPWLSNNDETPTAAIPIEEQSFSAPILPIIGVSFIILIIGAILTIRHKNINERKQKDIYRI
jgi:hypothetical protein